MHVELINGRIHTSVHVHTHIHTHARTHAHITYAHYLTIASQNFTTRHHYKLITRRMTKAPASGIKTTTKCSYRSLSKTEKTKRLIMHTIDLETQLT